MSQPGASTTGVTSSNPLIGVTAARLPAAGLAALAPVRDLVGVRIHPAGERVWVTWPADLPRVARLLIGVTGAEFFTRRGTAWHRFGHRLSTSDAPPDDEGLPLTGMVLPGRITPLVPESREPTTTVILTRGGVIRAASALMCSTSALATWAAGALTTELAGVRVATDGERAILIGDRLPSLPGATRFWGMDVFLPLGFRTEPELPDALIRAAAGAEPDELLILTPNGAEIIARSAFAPATRAGLRLAENAS